MKKACEKPEIGKLLCVLLVFATLAGGMARMANAEESIGFADVQKDFWGKAAIAHWSGKGVISGDDVNFHPDDSITRAEIISILVRVSGYGGTADNPFADVKPEDWYCDALAKAHAKGLLQGDFDRGGNRMARPGDPLTRAEAAVLFARIFSIEKSGGGKQTGFQDKDLPPWAKEAVSGMEASGYIKGKGSGLYDPQGKLTRAEAVQILDNIVKLYINEPGSYGTDTAGNVVVNTPGTVLRNMKITGSLYLLEGIGEGDCSLENVTVTGSTFVRGGGAGKISVTGCNLGLVSIEKDGIVLEETQPAPAPAPTGSTGGSGNPGGSGGSGGSGNTGGSQPPTGCDVADY